jgi:hypothetical protein
MATTKFATRSLEKSGATITRNGNRIAGKIGNHSVEFIDQGGDVICLRVRRVTDLDCSQEDYAAGSWFDAIRPAIEWAAKMYAEDKDIVKSGKIQPQYLGLA